MKKVIFRIALIFILTFIGCQEESETIIQNSSSFQKNSPISDLLERTTQSPTGFDDILDGTNCFSVVLPVTITVNSQQIVVSSKNDFQLVKNAIDYYNNDDDIINFSFPITIKYKNFETQVISNANQYNAILANCGSVSEFDEIDCLSLVYPISMAIYNSNNQVANTLTFSNNSQFYNYINNLASSTFVSINYPITIVNPTNQNLVIPSNEVLITTIHSFIDDCDDDLIGGTNLTFSEVLTSGTWKISYFLHENSDKTSYYTGYNFTFNPNGTASAIKNATTIAGTWYSYLDNNEIELELTFQGDTLDDIEEDWKVIEFSTTVIRLKHTSGGNGGTDYLTYTKN